MLRFLGVPEPQIDDAVQDVFMVLTRRSEKYRPEASARAWVMGVTTRVAADYRKKRAAVSIAFCVLGGCTD